MHDKLNIKFEKIYSPLRVPDLRVDPSMQKAKGSKVKNIACVKCYKYGKMRLHVRNCPKPTKIPPFTITPELYVCSYVLVASSLPQYVVDMGVTKNIIQDQVDYVDFHLYSMGSQIVMLKNGSKGVLDIGVY